MTYLEAISISIASLVGVALFFAYFVKATEWAGDPHNYADKWMNRRKWLGWAMLFVQGVLLMATALYYTSRGG